MPADKVKVSQLPVEIVSGGSGPKSKVSQLAVEVVSGGEGANVRVSQLAIEVIMPVTPGDTNVVVEIPASEVSSPNVVVVSQASRGALVDGEGNAEISQVARGTVVRDDDDVEISQIVRKPVIRADEDLEISQVVRICIVKAPGGRDWWPTLNRIMAQRHGQNINVVIED